MNTKIIPQQQFLEQAVAEFVRKFPEWETNPNKAKRLEKAHKAVAAGNVRSTNDPHKFVVLSNTDPTGSYIVNRQTKYCECRWNATGKVCTHRVEAYLAVSAMEMQKQFERELDEQRRKEEFANLWQSQPGGTWDVIDSHILHVCDDGYTGATIMGVGAEMWCHRCNEQMPHTLLVRESRIAYIYTSAANNQDEVSE